MKKVLIICDNINEITALKRHFGEDYRVSGSNSAENALGILQNGTTDIAVYKTGSDMSKLLAFYKRVRQEPKTEKLPIIFIADEAVLGVLNDVASLEKAAGISPPVSAESMENLINSF